MNFYTELEERKKTLQEEQEKRLLENSRERQRKEWENQVTNDYINELSYHDFRDFIHTILPDMIKNEIANASYLGKENKIFFDIDIDEEKETITSIRQCFSSKPKTYSVKFSNCYKFIEYLESIPNITCQNGKDSTQRRYYCVKLDLTDAINFYYGELQREEHYKNGQNTNFYNELAKRKKYQEEQLKKLERQKQEEERAKQIKLWQEEVIKVYNKELCYHYYREFIHTILPEMIRITLINEPKITEETNINFSILINQDTEQIISLEQSYRDNQNNKQKIKVFTNKLGNGHEFINYLMEIPNISQSNSNLSREKHFKLNLLDAINFYYGELQREEHYKPIQLTKTYHEEEK